MNGRLLAAERGDDLDFAYGFARAHNRSMLDFCSADPRLLSSGYVPLRDFQRAREMARELIDQGFNALLGASGCPRGHSPSHGGLDPVWAQAQEAVTDGPRRHYADDQTGCPQEVVPRAGEPKTQHSGRVGAIIGWRGGCRYSPPRRRPAASPDRWRSRPRPFC